MDSSSVGARIMIEDLLVFIADSSNWQGADGIPRRALEHMAISLLAVAMSACVALPLGFYIGHTGKLQVLGVNLANIGRAIPSYAVMVMLLPVMLGLAPTLGYDPQLGLTFLPIFLAMLLLAIPPILVATYAGILAVDRDLIESSRGMGLSERQILWSVEIPLASPLIVDGIRVALLQVIATATMGAILAGGGLGRYIIDGFALRDDGMLLAGVLFVALLAIGTDVTLSWLKRRLTPKGVDIATSSQPVNSISGGSA